MTIRIPNSERDAVLRLYREILPEIRHRLDEFRGVPPARYFYELCYCLLTPQSKASVCALACSELERRGFLQQPFDPESLLRSPGDGYVRFHRVKARRLVRARESFPPLAHLFHTSITDRELRVILSDRIEGLGFKEASHFLRNIGRTGVTILDRHILRGMVELGVLRSVPSSMSRTRYEQIETSFRELADALRILPEELDLLLWSRKTGAILK
ncbi:MAG: N-glycosylase [Bacteroidota bacterium]|nr:N-glycosylase [Bacteroidota bacterium]